MSAEPADGILGNTIPKSSKKSLEVKKFCFTLNNYTSEEVNELKNTLNTLGKWLFGYEVGENNTPHLQGFILLPKKKSWQSFTNILNNKRLHIECAKGSVEQNEIYCSKDGKIESNYFELEEQLDILDKSNFSDWMKEIDLLTNESANKRTVNWYWEPNGGVGKSTFAKYLCHAKNAIYIDEGKKSDLINIIYNVKKITSKSIIVIDIPRDNKNNTSYKAIEQIKNGMICNTKFETGMKLFNSPHVIIFSNFPPDRLKLSSDRWNIKYIGIGNDNIIEIESDEL